MTRAWKAALMPWAHLAAALVFSWCAIRLIQDGRAGNLHAVLLDLLSFAIGCTAGSSIYNYRAEKRKEAETDAR